MKILFVSVSAVSETFELGDFVFCKVDSNKWLVAKVIKVGRKLFTCEYHDGGTDTFEAAELQKATKAIFTKTKDDELTTKQVDALKQAAHSKKVAVSTPAPRRRKYTQDDPDSGPFIPYKNTPFMRSGLIRDLNENDVRTINSEAALIEIISKKDGKYQCSPDIRRRAVDNKNATEKVYKVAITDYYPVVRISAARKTTDQKIMKIANEDGSQDVRSAAMSNKNATEQILLLGLKDTSYEANDVRRKVMENYNATEKVLLIGAKDEHPYVVQAAMENDNATEKVLLIGAIHEDYDARTYAGRNSNATAKVKKLVADTNKKYKK